MSELQLVYEVGCVLAALAVSVAVFTSNLVLSQKEMALQRQYREALEPISVGGNFADNPPIATAGG